MEVSNQILSHPRVLPKLFFVEMWERFSYYGMRALLVLYLVKSMGLNDSQAGLIYGGYTSLVYLTPLIGGYLADKFLGLRLSIGIGAYLMLFGHFSLALDHKFFFFFGLMLLVIGNGFFKPNMSTLIGVLYTDRPALRDSGFTIFYMGINLGAFVGPLLTGYLAEALGWHFGFGLAAGGLALGIALFHFTKIQIPEEPLDTAKIIQSSDEEEKATKLILWMSFFSIFFWMAFEQMGSSLNLFADRYIEREVLGFLVPTAWFQSINPIFILLFAPILTWMWGKKKSHPFKKFSMALLLLGLGFLVLVLVLSMGGKEKIPLYWLVLAYFWHTIGELYISPTGLSFVSSTAPKDRASLLMGIWFLSNAVAHFLGGLFSGAMELDMKLFFGFFVVTSWSASLALYLFYKSQNRNASF